MPFIRRPAHIPRSPGRPCGLPRDLCALRRSDSENLLERLPSCGHAFDFSRRPGWRRIGAYRRLPSRARRIWPTCRPRPGRPSDHGRPNRSTRCRLRWLRSSPTAGAPVCRIGRIAGLDILVARLVHPTGCLVTGHLDQVGEHFLRPSKCPVARLIQHRVRKDRVLQL